MAISDYVSAADLTRLVAAATSGVTQVRLADGRTVVYASLAELWAAIERLDKILDPAGGSRPVYTSARRGGGD